MGKAWFGHYRLDRLLGSGGTGQVWLARDTVADRAVAVKILACAHTTDPTCRLRFTREARLAAQAPGPHRVPIHAFGELDGRLYIDMEFIEGTDVAALVREAGPLDPARAVAIIAQTAMALDAMHRIGLVHRDVKPSNIMVGPTGFVHLIDFGIAHRIDQPAITAHGNVIGTLAYMAPERFDGIAEARADQYSLACVLYECLTGQRPFGNADSPQQLRAHLLTAPPSAATLNPAVPASLDRVIARAMAKDPSQRYSSAGEFAATAYTAATGREASTVEIAASTVLTTHAPPKPWRTDAAEPTPGPCVPRSAGNSTRSIETERPQVPQSAAASMQRTGSAAQQPHDAHTGHPVCYPGTPHEGCPALTKGAGCVCGAVRGEPSEWAEMRPPNLRRGGGARMGEAGSGWESVWAGGAVGEWMRHPGAVGESAWVGRALGEPVRGRGRAGERARDGESGAAWTQDVEVMGESARGELVRGDEVVGRRARAGGTSHEATWVDGGVGDSTREAELRGEREGVWGVGPGHAAAAIAALVALIGFALWLGRPGGESSSATPSSGRTTPAVPGSVVPTESAQAASPNVVIPGVGQRCDPDVDGTTAAADGTPLTCRTVGGGIANWAPAQPFGELPDGQQLDPTVVGNGNPHVNNSADGDSGNDKPNKGKPGHGGRAKPGK
ncbi:serine/threonine-protein kinase [Nocardia sp. NPDC052112]|uniref:serine/threonine-protein kinase n=1 Tax=Nocardia sp. NPDC052112 TaxID=3155646 RepID=UPI00342CA7AB